MRSKLLKALVDSERSLIGRNPGGPIGTAMDAIKGRAQIDVPYLTSLRKSEPGLFDRVSGGIRMSEDFADDIPESIGYLSRHPELQSGKIYMDKGLTRLLSDSDDIATIEKGRVFVPEKSLEKIRNFEQTDAKFPRISFGNDLSVIAQTGNEDLLRQTAGRLGLPPDDLLDILLERNKMLSRTQRGILEEDVPGFRDLIERLYKPIR